MAFCRLYHVARDIPSASQGRIAVNVEFASFDKGLPRRLDFGDVTALEAAGFGEPEDGAGFGFDVDDEALGAGFAMEGHMPQCRWPHSLHFAASIGFCLRETI